MFAMHLCCGCVALVYFHCSITLHVNSISQFICQFCSWEIVWVVSRFGLLKHCCCEYSLCGSVCTYWHVVLGPLRRRGITALWIRVPLLWYMCACKALQRLSSSLPAFMQSKYWQQFSDLCTAQHRLGGAQARWPSSKGLISAVSWVAACQ